MGGKTYLLPVLFLNNKKSSFLPAKLADRNVV